MTFWVAGAVVVGGALTANAAGAAADSQAASTEAGIAEQRRQYDLTRADQAPYRDVGARSLGRLEIENDWALNPASVQLDPGYEFARQQGQQAIDRRTAAAGGRISGAALKAASQYNTDYATTGYSTAYNRVNQARSDRLNRLAALAQHRSDLDPADRRSGPEHGQRDQRHGDGARQCIRRRADCPRQHLGQHRQPARGALWAQHHANELHQRMGIDRLGLWHRGAVRQSRLRTVPLRNHDAR
jgi:hypothetical protein